MVKLARKAIAPQVRTLASVIDDMAVLKARASEIDKECKLLEKEMADFLGDTKKDGVYQGNLYQMMIKSSEAMYIDNDKVLGLVGATVFESLKSPRITVRKTFVKKEH